MSRRALMSFADGSVGIFHLSRGVLEWQSLPGHAETIFDLRYQPSNRDTLATASYDSTVKVWHTPTMKCLETLVGQEGVIYGISWAPGTVY